MLEKSRQTLSLSEARPRNVDNLRKWVTGNACISREETEYLEMEDDLANIIESPDSVMSTSESIVTDCTYHLDHAISTVST